MTIKQLLGMSPDELEKLSDDQLREYLKPHISSSTDTVKKRKQLSASDIFRELGISDTTKTPNKL